MHTPVAEIIRIHAETFNRIDLFAGVPQSSFLPAAPDYITGSIHPLPSILDPPSDLQGRSPVQRSLRSPRYISSPYPTFSTIVNMRVSIVLAALAAVASATSVSKRQIPDCATTCIMSADVGTCGRDNTCLCKSDAFVNSTYGCISSTCKGNDLEQAVAAARALCIAAGVTLTQTVPASTGATGTGATPTATSPTTSSPTTSSGSNGAISLSGSPMIGALAAVAGVVFAL
ncbi:CFEM domain, partial [Rhizoctonia solani]